MTFLAPAWLFLMLLAGPLLLLHARRRRRVEVASVRLWQIMGEASPPKLHLQWPRVTPLLLLQLAIIVFAALALAQPRLAGSGPVADHTVFMLDVSGRMRATDAEPTRFEAARAEIARHVEAIAAEGGGRVSLVAVGARPEPVFVRQGDPAGVAPLLEALAVSDAAADWPAAFELVSALTRPGELTDLVLLAGAEAEAALGDSAAQTGLRVTTRGFGAAETANAALAATIAPRVTGGPGAWRLEGTVRVGGGMEPPESVALRFGREGIAGDLDWGTVPLRGRGIPDPETGIANYVFSADLDFPGAGRLTVSLPGDALPHDDAARFVLGGAPRMLRVLLVGREDPELIRALGALGNVELGVSEALVPVDAFDLVVVNDAVVARRPATNVLWIGRGRTEDDLAPGAPTNGYVSLWRGDHPVSRLIDWSALDGPRLYPVAPLAGGTVLVEAAGLPVLEARTTGSGREVRLNIDPVASRWTEDPGFPAFIANVVDWLQAPRGAALGEPCIAGLACAIEARDLASRILGPEGATVYPGFSRMQAPVPDGVDAGFVPRAAGFYTVEDGAVRRTIAVNAAPAAVSAPPADAAGGASTPYEPVQYWWWLAAIVLALLIIEAILAARAARPVLPADARPSLLPRTARGWSAFGLRAGAIALVIAALATAPLPMPGADRAVVTVLAANAERPGGDAARASLLSGLDAIDSGIVLAETAPGRILRDQSGADPLDAEAAGLGAADVGSALELALAMLPGDRPGRLLLATDGLGVDGGLGAMLAGATGRQVAIDVLPLAAPSQGEVLVAGVDLPQRAVVGDSYPLNAFLYSEAEGEATVTILREGEVVTRQDVVLNAGHSRIEASLDAVEAGPALVEILVEAAGDPTPRNSRDGAIIDIADLPSILVIAPDGDWGDYFSSALNMQGLPANVVGPRNAPLTLEAWLEHDLIVLMNMPALALSINQQTQLEEAVARFGRGLMILGGENAFGPGGYYQTPLEEISPLSSRVPHEAPVASLIFVLDRSGSMQAPVGNSTRLDIAKAATLSAAELLNEESRVGIIAFDSKAYNILPLLENRDLARISEALDPVVPGGGTALHPALTEAVEALAGDDSDIRHIIVMTDGLVEQVDFTEVLARANEAGVTISTIAISTSAVTDRLETIARIGGGTYHMTRDIRALPSILAQETLTMRGSPVTERTTAVFWTDRSQPFLAGLPAQMPPLSSYVATTPKPEADLHMGLIDAETGEMVPVMATWRYGNGRVLAFASHGAGSGTQYWLSLPNYPLFWAQTARHFLPGTVGPGLNLRLERRGDGIEVTADLLDARGNPIRNETVMAILGSGRESALVETAPGRYQGGIAALDPGDHSVTVATAEASAEGAIHIGYPARLDVTRSGLEAVTALSALTGGRVVETVSEMAPGTAWSLEAHWRPWLLAGLALFLIELAARYGVPLFSRARRRIRPAG